MIERLMMNISKDIMKGRRRGGIMGRKNPTPGMYAHKSGVGQKFYLL
jgi:hypothetical protein